MDKKRFDAMLPMITADLSNRIMQKYNLGEDKALSDLDKSQVYALLENEATKVWQYSTDMLLELYDREINGNLILPEV